MTASRGLKRWPSRKMLLSDPKCIFWKKTQVKGIGANLLEVGGMKVKDVKW